MPGNNNSTPTPSDPRTPTSNDPQEPKPLLRASTTFYERVITDWWWWELGSWLVSFACVTAIVGLLLYYDGKKQPNNVMSGITLNALIAVLAAIAKAALILPVSEAIGQLKWIWFRKGRPLFDFYAYDNASRGPWGSLVLLCMTKGRYLVSVGAAITILALAFEPFFQQSVSYHSRNSIVNSGTIYVTTSVASQEADFSGVSFRTWADSVRDSGPRYIASQIAKALSVRDTPVKAVTSVCPTSQCSWAAYSTLGVCHQCQDVSSLLVPVCQIEKLASSGGMSGSFQYPCGYRLNNTLVTGVYGFWDKKALGLSTLLLGGYLRRDIGLTSFWNSTSFPNAQNAILGFYIGFQPGGEPHVSNNSTPVLMECVYQWCVRTYEASYKDGHLEEKLLATYLPPDVDPAGSVFAPDGLRMTAAGQTFSVGPNVTGPLSLSLSANLPQQLDNSTLDDSAQYPGRWNFVQKAPYDVNTVLGTIADVVSKEIRAPTNKGTERVRGDAWGPEPFVKVQWQWASLPAFLLLSTLALVCATIFESRKEKVPAWKSSALAALLHGLSEESRAQFVHNASQSEVEKMARSMRAKMLLKNSTEHLTAV